ncbi:MAG TPA: hypothetical protein PLD59_01975, partial [Tepidisphaeraceae bacterium]|nr:hypothetical protein [Tepidisphaeraceae bacterium]
MDTARVANPTTESFELVHQVGKAGYFIRIGATVCERRDDGVSVTFSATVDSTTRAGVVFGIEFAWERIGRESTKLRGGLIVDVTSVESVPIDTTLPIVAYGASQLIFKIF